MVQIQIIADLDGREASLLPGPKVLVLSRKILCKQSVDY
jgi:hypothetical protein